MHFQYGRSGQFASGRYYTDMSLGLAYRLEHSQPHLLVRATLGYQPQGFPAEILLQYFSDRRLQDSDGAAYPGNYDVDSLAGSLVFPLKEGFSLQAGYSHDVYVRNTGEGHTWLAKLWYHF
jgi:hypothetical protein